MSIKLNIIDWNDYDEIEDESETSIDEKYYIEIFGKTKKDKSVYLKVTGFTPHFYIEVDDFWKKKHLRLFIDSIRNMVWPKKYKDCLIDFKLKKKHNLYGFKAGKKFKFVMLAFTSVKSMKKFQYIFYKDIFIPGVCRKKKFKLYETNIPALLRFLHIRNINASGWIKLDEYKSLNKSRYNTDIAIETKWTNVISIDDNSISKIKILSYDIECTSSDNGFPQPHRIDDKIIQIGSTFSYNGKEECYYKHIVTLNSCDPINGVDVESYDNETDLLLAWQKIIIKEDPDIITGYNIFGFDEVYIRDRVKLLNVKNFGIFSRIKEQSKFKELKLTSSALGDNKLKYYNTIGRVKIDLFKVVQRDYKLKSYKLDSVAEHFLSGNIKSFNKNKLIIKGVKELLIGNYIKIIVDGSPINDGEKFKIINITDDEIEINKELSIDEYRFMKWALSKDDVHATDIFRLQKGSSSDRAIVAKYCIQDCCLVNKLMARLCIITNNIGMSNVCSIPLSYLFFRGQGIKIFSLVAKYCREMKYIIPVIKKPPTKCLGQIHTRDKIKGYNDNWLSCSKCNKYFCSKECKKLINHICEKSTEGYEGATVFNPDIGFYKRPIAVLDYASLYPSCMIQKNLSHETFVDDPKYDNLPNYNYWIAEYRNNNGTMTKCKYAQNKDGTLGIMPTILSKLLSQRKATKKIMKKEKDYFKKSIYDGLQLAYKLTANSLYGQIGSSVSPIYMKAIAASTTSTGREMLEFARDYMENIFPPIVTKIYEYNQQNEKDKLKELLDNELKPELNNEKFINGTVDTIDKILKTCSIDPKTVYGDSITGDTPLLLKYNDKIFIKTIETLSDEWKPYEEFKKFDTNRTEKQQSDCNMLVWTYNKWTKIKRVIRHKTNKKIYRINTHCGVVDVTEDHSLLDVNKRIIKPNDCSINSTELLTSFPSFPDNNNIMKLDEILSIIYDYNIKDYSNNELEAYLYGFFYGDGSCGKYDTKWGVKYTWALNNKDDYLLNIFLSILNKLYSDKTGFKILDTLKSSGVKKLVPKGSIKYMVNKFRPIFYDKNKYKIIPDIILNADYKIRLQFFLGYYAADGSKVLKSKTRNIRFSNKGKIGTSQLYYLLKSLNYQCSVSIRKDKLHMYRISCCINKCHKTKLRKKNNIIKKIEYLYNSNDYVYDLETEQGYFNAGIGDIIVKNTDSVFIDFQFRLSDNSFYQTKEALKFAIDLGIIAGNFIKTRLIAPQDLEYEKTFYPFCILSKKRYVGNKYEFDYDSYYQNSMGIVLKRRDNANIVKKIVGGMVDILLNEIDTDKAIKFVKKSLKRLMDGYYPISDFETTKTLKGVYKDRTKIPHVCLADRITLREPGNAPQINTRIPYITIVINEKKIMKQKIKLFKNNVTNIVTYFIKKQNNLLDCYNILDDNEMYEYKKLQDKYKNIYNIEKYFKENLLGSKIKYYIKKNILNEIRYLILNEIADLDKSKKYQDGSIEIDNYFHTEFNNSSNIDKYIKIIFKNNLLKKLLDIYKPNILQGDRIEHPDYIRKNNVKIDYLFYLTNQIKNPTNQFLELLTPDSNQIFEEQCIGERNKRKNQNPITKFFTTTKKVKSKSLLKYYVNDNNIDLNKFESDESSSDESEEIKNNNSNKKKIINNLFSKLNEI